jgi:hypothetical protein
MTDDALTKWLAALEARHLANYRVAEVTRALRALSSAYVQRRHKLASGGALDTAGKRAAFALFYGPLHFLTVAHVVRALGADVPAPSTILDLGCGTGVAGAAWALSAQGVPRLTGIDRHPWAVEETRWCYRQLGLQGDARVGDLSRLPRMAPTGAVIAAYTLNELSDDRRSAAITHLLEAAAHGTRVLILEPIARGIAPWWDDAAAKVTQRGGRVDEWRFAAELPPLVRLLDKSAGLDHRELTVRTLYLG